MDVIARALGAQPPDLKFFNLTTAQIAGVTVRALRHGMAGQPGWELFGPWEDYEPVHAAIVAAGQEFGLRLVGRPRVLLQRARVRLDPLAAAGGLHRR